MIYQINHSEVIAKFSRYSREELNFVITDAHDAIEANPDNGKASYYADEIHYAAAEIRRRGGLPILSEAERTAKAMMIADGSICSVWIAFHSAPLRVRMFGKFGRDGLIAVQENHPEDVG